MYILLPLPEIHSITEEIIGETVGLVSFDLQGVLSITENRENGYAIIRYKSGDVIETFQPFDSLFEQLGFMGAINYLGQDKCRKISKPLDIILKKHKL